jgi:hypothetical protein
MGVEYVKFGNKFNNQFNQHLPNLIHLTLGKAYNQEISFAAMDKLKHLKLGKQFNQSIDYLPDLISLEFDYWCHYKHYDSLILPDTITHVKFAFMQRVWIDLPDGIISAHIGYLNNHTIPPERLPKTLKNLEVYSFGATELPPQLERVSGFGLGGITYLPNTLKYISAATRKRIPPGLIPEGVESLEITSVYELENLPDSIKKLKVVRCAEHGNNPIGDLPKYLEYLAINYSFNHPFIIPEGIKCIYFNNTFNQPIELPKSVRELQLGYCYSHPLPENTKLDLLIVHSRYEITPALRKNVKKIKIIPESIWSRYAAVSPWW